MHTYMHTYVREIDVEIEIDMHEYMHMHDFVHDPIKSSALVHVSSGIDGTERDLIAFVLNTCKKHVCAYAYA